MTSQRLAEKAIVVTGGSSGLGRAMSLAFAREGAVVVVGDIRPTPRAGGIATVDQIREEGGTALFVEADVAQAPDIDRLVREAVRYGGRLDVMVNSAVCVGHYSKGLLETSERDWDTMMAVNLRGVFLCCRRAVREMLGQGPRGETRGRIINMASQMGLIGTRGHVAYCAGKGAVVGLTRQVAVDYARDGIVTNAIAPGKVPTNPLDATPEEHDPMEYVLLRTPYPRLGRPEDVAGMAVYLASEECSFVSGTTVSVDGGWLAS